VLLFGSVYRLFDVGGAAGILGMLFVFTLTTCRTTVKLYRKETRR
jgi:hypothetical protein